MILQVCYHTLCSPLPQCAATLFPLTPVYRLGLLDGVSDLAHTHMKLTFCASILCGEPVTTACADAVQVSFLNKDCFP